MRKLGSIRWELMVEIWWAMGWVDERNPLSTHYSYNHSRPVFPACVPAHADVPSVVAAQSASKTTGTVQAEKPKEAPQKMTIWVGVGGRLPPKMAVE